MAQEENLDNELASASNDPEAQLVAWIVSRAGFEGRWSQDRDQNHKDRWEEYYRLWRGIWNAADKTRKSERSRLIVPALTQAVEAVASEIESAVLDKKSFFDVEDDVEDTRTGQDEDVGRLRQALTYDMRDAQYELALAEIFLNGSLFGTGIGKLNLEKVPLVRVEDGQMVQDTKDQLQLVSVLPQQFSIDTAAKKLSDALGMAHTYHAPLHEIWAKQQSGFYRDVPVHKESVSSTDALTSDETPDSTADSAGMCDYRGKVPRALLEAVLGTAPDEEEVDLFPEEDADSFDFDENDLVEAFVLVVNESHILKVQENPFPHKDRMFVAYRHETVMDQFWGRGAAEKGYNAQKALDASMRARIDGLALTVHPMMAINASLMPRGFKFNVTPGRNILTQGNPDEVIKPIRFGNIDPNIFTDNAELERMVSMATGGFDTAAPVNVNNRNETASGMSMQLGNFVKRSKRTIRNIENELIVPLVQQTARVYMAIDPERYPLTDYTFRAMSVLGTMARELEQAHYAQMMNTVPETSPAFWMLMKSFYQSSSLSNREEMTPMIDQQLQTAMNPPPPPADPLVELKRMEIMGRIQAEKARITVELIRARAEVSRAANDARLAPSEEAKNESEAILNLAKAEAEEIGTQLDAYTQQYEAMKDAARIHQEATANAIERPAQSGIGNTDGAVPAPGLGAV